MQPTLDDIAEHAATAAAGALEHILVAVFVVDRDGRLTYLNPAAEGLSGVRRADAVGRLLRDAVPPVAGEQFCDACRRATVGRETVVFEAPSLPHGPTPGRWLRVRAVPTAGGGLYVFAHDLTDAYEAQQRLRRSEERFRSLIDATAAIVWDTPAGGEFEHEQPGWTAFTGQTFDELKGWGWLDAVHPGDRADTADVWSRALAGRTLYQVEHRLRRRDGQYRHMLVRAAPIVDESGTVREWVGAHTDVTPIRQAEAAVRERDGHVRLLLDSTAEGIYGLDADGRCTFANAACARLLGYGGPSDVVGQDMHGLIHHTRPDGRPYPVDECPICRAFRAERGTHVADEVLWRKDGTSFPAEYWSHPVRREGAGDGGGVGGDIAGLVVTFIDITDRRRQERQLSEYMRAVERANEMLEGRVRERTVELQGLNAELRSLNDKLQISNRELQDFASVASHDLQEPLRKIRAFGDRLNVKSGLALTDEGRDYLARMLNAAERMQTLISDLLAFSRVTTKAQPFRPVDLNAVAAETLSDLEARVQQAGGTVTVDPLPTIDADPLQIRQLLQNLIANALKFVRPGVPPAVRVTGDVIPGEGGAGDTVELRVADNGIGFDEKYLDRIFNVFQRLHGRGVYEGTGIGLAVCRKIVERHGGSITARSRPDEGATFVIRLPAKQP